MTKRGGASLEMQCEKEHIVILLSARFNVAELLEKRREESVCGGLCESGLGSVLHLC